MSDEETLEQIVSEARQLLRKGQFRDALEKLEPARAFGDLEPDLHDALATSHYMLGNLDVAAEHFERVTRLDPRRGSAWTNLGAVYNRLGNYARAAEVLRRAVQVDRHSSAAYYNLGSAYRHLKQWAMAVPAYREAIRLEPDQPDAYVNLGQVYFEIKNFPQATVQFKKALELRPDSARARKGISQCDAATNALQSKSSPFGRLVDAEQLKHGQEADELSHRRLSESERIRDRQQIQQLCATLEGDAAEVLNSLNDRIANALFLLTKGLALASKRERDAAALQALEQLAEARREYAPRLLKLRRSMKQFRDHEGSVR
ncbi:MAG: tetratricopeptide repeat protein [Planctomycetaceae bacterium]|nr:MAG: tetratricopeptide repeat protein [Planctomycetaceae bacterium]